MQNIEYLITWEYLIPCFWFFVIMSHLLYHISPTSKNETGSLLIYKFFGNFAGILFSATSLGIAGSTSINLLKGFYFQIVLEKEVYFQNLGDIDIYSLFVVVIFLLVYSLLASLNLLSSALFSRNKISAQPKKIGNL